LSYLVLARKYRPQTFAEVVGQEHVTRTLANAFAKGRVHHAFLLCGPRGVGKTTLARILGKALNCERGPTAEPCGECSACETITGGSAVDYFEMDGASNRGIDSIRELTDAVRYQPAVLRKKVYVIDEVHMLTTEAFNALLKTLEEPPPHVSFVLATTEPHKVPNTILSRCQRYDFKLVPAPRLAAHLTNIFAAEELDIEPGAVSLIVRESGGSVRDALSLCDQIISYVGDGVIREVDVADVLGVADRSLTRAMVMALAEGDARTALESVESAVARGVDEVQLARAIVRYLRDLSVTQVAPDADSLVEGSADERADLADQARRVSRDRVIQMFDRMIRACDELGRTQQPRLVLDLALIDVAALEPMVPLGDLIDRLGDLERRLAGGGGPSGPRGGGRGGRSHSQPRNQPRGGARASGYGAGAAQAAPAAPAAQAAPKPRAAGEEPASRRPSNGAPTNAPTAAPTNAPTGSSGEPPHPAEAFGDAGWHSAPEPTGRGPQPDDEPPFRYGEPSRTASENGQAGWPTNGSAGRAAAPAAPQPPSASPTSGSSNAPAGPRPDGDLAEWAKLLAALQQSRKVSLYGCFEHAKLLSWKNNAIEVGFSEDYGMIAEMASDADNMAAMKAFLHKRYGHPIALTVRTLTADEATSQQRAESVIEARRRDAAAERNKREDDARKHPSIRMVLSEFDAQIKEIKTYV
jgi:DNA polymerase-3 subunit gamma/tau